MEEVRARSGTLYLASMAFILAFGALYWNVIPEMIADWSVDENYSHGFLVPVISAYILWGRRDAMREAANERRSSLWGLAICLGALVSFVVGRAGAELFLQRSSLIILLLGGVLWVWGWPLLKVTAFPLVFLLLMVPLPYLIYDSVAFPLKLFAARVATEALFLFDVPVFREGNVIHLTGKTLEVADACSGIRSLVSLVTLGIVYAYFTETMTWKRVFIVVSTIPIAIAANAFRVTGTGILTHYLSPKAAEGFFHTFSGWLVFVFAFIMLFAVGGALKFVGKRR